MKVYQKRALQWALTCFDSELVLDKGQRVERFIEESLELAQSLEFKEADAIKLVRYVFGRDKGEPSQEVGGVVLTLSVLCEVYGIDVDAEGERELARVWTKIQKIREKQKGKPKHSPLPGPTPE